MSKILITDMLNTLFPDDDEILLSIYGDRSLYETLSTEERMNYLLNLVSQSLDNFIEQIRSFLDGGNEIVIVTDGGHMSPFDLVEVYLNKIFAELQNYASQIKVFMIGVKEYDFKYCDRVEDGHTVFLSINGLKIGVIDKKDEVFEHLDLTGKELYVLGDNSFKDGGMLIKGVSLNGQSSIIDYKLLNRCVIDELEPLDYTWEIGTYKHYLGLLPKLSFANITYAESLPENVKKHYQELQPVTEEANKLYALFQSGEISLEDLYVLYKKYEILYDFNISFHRWKDNAQIHDIQFIERCITNFHVFSSFQEYQESMFLSKTKITKL